MPTKKRTPEEIICLRRGIAVGMTLANEMYARSPNLLARAAMDSDFAAKVAKAIQQCVDADEDWRPEAFGALLDAVIAEDPDAS